MPTLYVANGTKQRFEFNYRAMENPTKVVTQVIGIGQQVRIPNAQTTEAIDHIVNQHVKYGLTAVADIGKKPGVVALIYSVDQPISVATLQKLMMHNTGQLVEKGREIRQKAAIVNNAVLEQHLKEAGLPETLTETGFSIVEENHDDRDGTEPVAEGVIVNRSANEDGSMPVGKRVGSRRSKR